MGTIGAMPEVIRFGLFELDVQEHELRKRGLRLRIETKPLRILELLLERPGEIVTRKEIQEALWPDTHVAFEYSLNTAVNKLRAGLGDSAENQRFVETIARRGYRFIGAVRQPAAKEASSSDNRDATAATRAGTSRTQAVSLAVLPFQTVGERADLEYLSDGMGEAVIRRVSQIPGVRVMAWSTVLRYKRGDLEPLAVGRELAVQSVLVGRIVPREETVTLNLELVDVTNGAHMWGEEYSRGWNDIQTLPGEIARELAARLKHGAGGEDKVGRAERHTQNPEAYADYLHGRHHWHRLTPDALPRSVVYFESAIAKDPEFGLAHAALAEAYLLFAFIGLLHPREALERANEAVTKALRVDEQLPEAHASFGNVIKLREHDWATAEREYLRCLEIDPNNVIALRGYGNLLSALGRDKEAVEQIRKAQEIDPLSMVVGIDAAWNLYMARDYKESLEQARKMEEMQPGSPASSHLIGMSLTQLGRLDEAIEWLQKNSERSFGHYAAQAALAHALGISGKKKEAGAIVVALRAAAKEHYISPFCLALAEAGTGENARALDALEKAFDEHDVWLIWLGREPRLDSLRAEPRFKKMLRRMKLAPAAN